MLQLHPDKVQLWFAFCDEIAEQSLLADYRRLLVDEERQKEARFHFARDRHRYLITRALVRTVLSRYASVMPQDWRFAEDTYGRPQIVNDHAAARRISFNVSHTSSLVVLGVSCERALGVDTEDVQTRRADLQIADHYFSVDEVTQLRATPPELQQARFFEYWTLKESYIKARGFGLALPLGDFAFKLNPPGPPEITFEPALEDDPRTWQFLQDWPTPQHRLGLAVRREGSDLPVRLRFVTP